MKSFLVLMMSLMSLAAQANPVAKDCSGWLESARLHPAQDFSAEEKPAFVAFITGINNEAIAKVEARATELKLSTEKYLQSNQAVDDLLADLTKLSDDAANLVVKDPGKLFCENLKIAMGFAALYQQRFPPTDILGDKGTTISQGMNALLKILGISI